MEHCLILAGGNCLCRENLYGPQLPLHYCFLISLASAIFGFFVGVAVGPVLSKHPPEQNVMDSDLALRANHSQAAEKKVSKEEKGESKGGKMLELKRREERIRENESDRNTWKPTTQRCAPFANSLRKLSVLSGLPHGLIEARGKGLEIVSIDHVVRQLLGTSTKAENAFLQKTVHGLLPTEIREHHRRVVAKAMEDGDLPSSLMHPMRNIPMLRCDGSIVRVDFCVGVITKVQPHPSLRHVPITSLSHPGLATGRGEPRRPTWRLGGDGAVTITSTPSLSHPYHIPITSPSHPHHIHVTSMSHPCHIPASAMP